MTAASPETAVAAKASEAQSFYQRGVAAARGGQKRVAAVMLTRAVQLDPQNERAWLWLSGVIDDPRQQAFCLDAVLKLNPQNQHALRGRRWLEERKLLEGGASPLPGLEAPAPPAAAGPSDHRESWWVNWRRSRREMSRARLLLWVFPLILVCLAIGVYESLAWAVARSQPAAAPAADVSYSAAVPPPQPIAVEAILEAEPPSVVESLTIGYLGAVEPVRAELRAATADYRQVTSQPGGASVGHVAATQRLRAAVSAALATLAELRPPGTLAQAHADYQRGLELELEGLDAMLQFYSAYNVADANRAALHFQESRAYIERAIQSFSAQSQQLASVSSMSAHTPR